MQINPLSTVSVRLADNATHAGGIGAVIISIISWFSPGEWMVIGIIVGIICSVVGLISGIFFRFRRERLLAKYLASRDITDAARLMVD